MLNPCAWAGENAPADDFATYMGLEEGDVWNVTLTPDMTDLFPSPVYGVAALWVHVSGADPIANPDVVLPSRYSVIVTLAGVPSVSYTSTPVNSYVPSPSALPAGMVPTIGAPMLLQPGVPVQFGIAPYCITYLFFPLPPAGYTGA